MKFSFWVLSFGVLAGCHGPSGLTKDQYEVRRETSSGFCRIDLTTAAPSGEKLSGPFDSKTKACESARDQYDETGTGSHSCTDYLSGTVTMCRDEGIKLPGTRLSAAKDRTEMAPRENVTQGQ